MKLENFGECSNLQEAQQKFLLKEFVAKAIAQNANTIILGFMYTCRAWVTALKAVQTTACFKR